MNDDSKAAARIEQLRTRLKSRRGPLSSSVRIFRAPGRVNLIGEHTDYNDGFVMPLAIGFDTWVLAEPREDDLVVAESLDFDAISIHRLGADVGDGTSSGHWSRYVAGVAESLRIAGHAVRGMDLVIHGNVPIGSGLSSSAALEVAVATAMIAYLDSSPPTDLDVARICQSAENDFVGARCGIMDQYAAVHGAAGHAIRLDCRSLQHELVPLEFTQTPARIVVCNTMVRHKLAGGEYNRRRDECGVAVGVLASRYPAVTALRDVTSEMLGSVAEAMDPVIYKRARHVIAENARVELASSALRRGDLVTVGQLMRASHDSLTQDYAVSCLELDTMVDIATRQKGVYGSRMTGGGFGGCTVNLVAPECVDAFRQGVSVDYERMTGVRPEIYVCDAVDGAGEVREH